MHPFRSSPTRFSVLYLTVLLRNIIILTGRGALQRYPESQVHPCLHEAQLEHRRQRHCHQLYQQTEPPQQKYGANAGYLFGITGGSSANRSRRKQHALSGRALDHEARRRPHGGDHALPGAIKVSGADLGRGAPYLDGVYIREKNADINGAPHFKKRSKRGSRSPPVHLLFTGHEWMLHLDANSELDVKHCLAYSEVAVIDPLKTTRRWAVRVGQAWVRRPHMKVSEAAAKDLVVEREAVGRGKEEEPTRGRQEVIPGVEGETIPVLATYNDSSTTGSPLMGAGDERRGSRDAALNKRLLPLYLVFVLDAVGLGVALPVLPFYVMGLRATALQLAVVVSSNYIAQTFGCIITGNLSDVMGRKPVMIGCLLGNVISNIVVARSKTLAGVAWGRIIGGVTGGLTPIAQAAVADVVPVQSLPKFIGRIQACVGLGFVLGPMTMTILHRLLRVSNGDTFYAAALFPLAALLYTVFRVPETKVREVGVEAEVSESVPLEAEIPSGFVPQERGARAERAVGAFQTDGMRQRGRYTRREHRSKGVIGQGEEDWVRPASEEIAEVVDSEGDGNLPAFDVPPAEGVYESGPEGMEALDAARVREVDAIPRAIMLLVGNGFLLMYAFSIETIYAMFLKDNFGYGESVLSMVFALNGVAVGALQLLGMRHLVRLLGKHVMLIVGNVFLAAGMVGVALSRNPVVHFALFTVHIMGYSLADTALVALISRYSSPATQGRSLGLNQAAQSMARVVSPVVAGVLYEWSKRRDSLPLGALPYLVGATFPLVGVAVPFWLYFRSIEAKKRIGVYPRGGWVSSEAGCGVVSDSTGAPFASENYL